MFLTIHAASGIIIGERTDNFFLAFILSFLIHFLIDLIPHGDRELAGLAQTQSQSESKAIEKFREFVKVSAIDGGSMLFLILMGYGLNLFRKPLSVALGIIGGITPDILVAFYFMISKNFLLKKIERIHNLFHHKIIKRDFPLRIGVSIQILIAIFLVGIIIFS